MSVRRERNRRREISGGNSTGLKNLWGMKEGLSDNQAEDEHGSQGVDEPGREGEISPEKREKHSLTTSPERGSAISISLSREGVR